jgi:hypothetical protein
MPTLLLRLEVNLPALRTQDVASDTALFRGIAQDACGVAARSRCAVRYTYGDAVVSLAHDRADVNALVKAYRELHAQPDRYTRSSTGHGYTLAFVDGAA